MQVDASDLPAHPGRRAEEIAMRVLPKTLGGKAKRVDMPDGADGLHDFDLIRDTGSVAVEVRSCVDPIQARFEDALDDHAIHRAPRGLSHSWELRLHESVAVKGLIDVDKPLLAELETLGVSGLGRRQRFPHEPMVRYVGDLGGRSVAPNAVQRLIDLGVDTAWAGDRADGELTVEFLRRSTHSSGASEALVTEEVDSALIHKSDVLSRQPALFRQERHLFVWLDADLCGEKEFALWSGRPDFAPRPTLPSHIDHCSVACWSSTPGEGIGHVVIWEADRDGPWRYPALHAPGF